jgi:hypothetical protein
MKITRMPNTTEKSGLEKNDTDSAEVEKALRKTLRDNPELPVKFIKDTLLAVEEAKSGQI